MNGQQIVDGCIGGDDDGICSHHAPLARFQFDRRIAVDAGNMGIAEDSPPAGSNGLEQTRHVLQRVKLGLSGKPQAGTGLKHIPRQPVQSLDTLDAGPSRGLPFFLDKVSGIIRRSEEITVQPRKVALDPFFESNLVDPINSGRVAMGRQLRAGLAMESFYFHVTIVEGVRQVRRRPLRLQPK